MSFHIHNYYASLQYVVCASGLFLHFLRSLYTFSLVTKYFLVESLRCVSDLLIL